tara:strand:- start:127 stop:333 length:207 start_codon:yes stop_codon:yes gene_type:complete
MPLPMEKREREEMESLALFLVLFNVATLFLLQEFQLEEEAVHPERIAIEVVWVRDAEVFTHNGDTTQE